MENEKTLGKTSVQLISKLYDENRTIFKINHAQKILGKSYSSTVDLLRDLVKEG